MLNQKRSDVKNEINLQGKKRVYYMCMEFLVGRSLKTNLCNLGLTEKDIVKPLADKVQHIPEAEAGPSSEAAEPAPGKAEG